MDVLSRIKTLMEARGWTAYRLASEAGLTESTIQNLFRRNGIPTLPTLEAVCSAFGITLSQFFADDDIRAPWSYRPCALWARRMWMTLPLKNCSGS